MGVERFNDRVIKVNIIIGDVVWEVVSCNCPQVGRSVNEKEGFHELMNKVVTNEKVLVGGDFNDHVGSDMGGSGEVHGGFVVGQINDGGIILLDWAVGKALHLMNTCFQKRKHRLITFRSGETETMIDYILVNNKYGSSVKDVKLILGKERESALSYVDGYGVQKECQEESKIQKEIETVEVERVRGERTVC